MDALNILSGLTAVVVLATFLPLLKSGSWWIRFLDFPRVPLTLLAIGLLGAWCLHPSEAGVLRFSAMVALCASLTVQSIQIYPFTAFHAKESLGPQENRGGNRVRLLVSNVLMSNRDSTGLMEVVRWQEPDILLLLEPDGRWAQEIQALHSTFSYRVEVPLDNTYGMILMSRMEIADEEVRYIVEDGVPSIHARVRLESGDWFTLHCLHPVPPDVAQDSTVRDAELVTVGREVAGNGQPSIVIGDLNDVAWSHTTRLFRRLSGLLDPRIGRGTFSTFPAGLPSGLLRYPLDHVFHSKEFRLASMKTLRAPGSDHLAVSATLVYQPDGETAQEAPAAHGQDHVEAHEIVAERLRGETRSPL